MEVATAVLDRLFDNMVPAESLFKEERLKGRKKRSHEQSDESDITPIETTSFQDLMAVFKEKDENGKGLFITQSIEDTLAVMLATSISTSIGGDEKLWVYVMGPPSSGKSLLCSAVASDSIHCKSLDKFTGFLSGFKQGRSKKDFSLIDDINNKTVVIKDFTSVLSQSREIQEKIFGELRFLSDGSASDHYLNGQQHDHKNIRFSMLCGVTDEILHTNRSGLGERFLMVDITDKGHGSQEHVKQALFSILASMQASFPVLPVGGADDYEKIIPPDRLLKIKQHTLGYMQHIHKQFYHVQPPHASEEVVDYCTSIGRFVGIVRGMVKREGPGRDLVYVPRAEIGVRLGAQLLKMGLSLSVVFNEPHVTKRTMRILRKVARDTARGYNFEIVSLVSRAIQVGGIGLDVGQISDKLHISKTDVQRRLADLKVLGLVQTKSQPNESGRRGRHRHIWQLKPKYNLQWEHLNGKAATPVV